VKEEMWLITLLQTARSISDKGSYEVAFPNAKHFNSKTFAYPVILFLYIVHLIWSLTLREERRLRVSENRALRRIFGTR
jgi:hypothetical protein